MSAGDAGDITENERYEAELAMMQRECIRTAADIVRTNLAKEEKDVTELREWLGRMDDMNSDRMMIATYIHEGDFANAIAIAKTLPDKYGLQGDDLSEHLDYVEIIRLHERLHETGRTALQLSDSEMTVLVEIADNGSGTSRIMARSLLDENRGIPTFAPTQCPTIPAYGAETRGNSQEKNMMTAKELDIVISPNPATTVLEVKYALPEDEYEADLVMINSLGMKVMSAKLYGEEGTATLDLGHLPAGMYFYDISCGEHRMSGKMIKR